MVIERQNNEIVIKLPEAVLNLKEVQRLLNYFRFIESNATNRGSEEQAATLAREVDATWWQANKQRFLP